MAKIRKLSYTEEELVLLLKQNNEIAFRYLYDNYSGALYTVINKIIKDKDAADDLIQDVFFKIWKNFANYQPEKSRLFTWMMNIARNAAIDAYRSDKVSNRSAIQDIETSVNSIDLKQNQTIETDVVGLRDLVDRLRPERKQLIDLAYFEGFTQEEIADKLQMPLGTVKTRIRSALQELRTVFQAIILLLIQSWWDSRSQFWEYKIYAWLAA